MVDVLKNGKLQLIPLQSMNHKISSTTTIHLNHSLFQTTGIICALKLQLNYSVLHLNIKLINPDNESYKALYRKKLYKSSWTCYKKVLFVSKNRVFAFIKIMVTNINPFLIDTHLDKWEPNL